MEIGRNKFVSLTYKLHLNGFDGEMQEEAVEATPLNFIAGAGMMLPKFEEHLEGLKKGAEYKFEIKANDGYGEIHTDRIVDLPLAIFSPEGEPVEDGLLEPGNVLPMMDAEGNRMNGTVCEITEEHVKMDFNHPMAGKDLFFTGSVIDVRDATEEELAELLGGGGGCGCGSGGCGSGEGSCGDGGCGDGGCSC